jgi:hypothetical protein
MTNQALGIKDDARPDSSFVVHCVKRTQPTDRHLLLKAD